MDSTKFVIDFQGNKIPAYYLKDATEQAIAFCEILSKHDGVMGIDIETQALPQYKIFSLAALSPHTSNIRLVQLYNGTEIFIFDMNHFPKEYLFPIFQNSKCRLVAHNALFEIKYFKHYGYPVENIGCSMLMWKIITHALEPEDKRASLQFVILQLFKKDILKKVQDSDWSNEELTFEQIEYAALDAACTYAVAVRLAPHLAKHNLQKYYSLCKATQIPVAAMELTGIGFDGEKHKDFVMKSSKELYAAKLKAMKETGLTDLTSKKLADWLVKNLDSETLAKWNRTPKGQLATDSDAFAEYPHLAITEPFKGYQHYFKLVSSWGSSFAEGRNLRTKRFHPGYFICGARTGRFSSSKPNIQQIPRESEVRNLFIPKDGHVFLCADYSQIELRVAAEVSRDKAMLDAYKNGLDLHLLTASRVARKPIAEVTKVERQFAKALNFGLLFGLGPNGFSHYAKKSYGVEVSQAEADDAINIFKTTYAGYTEWQQNQANLEAKRHPSGRLIKQVVTPYGKLRCLDVDNSYGGSMNTPIQGGAAECMMHSLCILHSRLEKAEPEVNGSIVACVHDEILCEVQEDCAEEVGKIIEESMTQGFLSVFPNGIINGIVEVKTGISWGEAKA